MLTNRQRTNKQTDVSKTESTLILSGSSPDTRGSWPILSKGLLKRNVLIGGKHIEAKRAAAPPVRKGIDISGTDLLIILRNIFIHSYNFLPVLNSFMIADL